MAKYVLLNTTTFGGGGATGQTLKLQAGEVVDDAQFDITKIQAAGGVLWPQGTALIDAASTLALALRKNKASNELAVDAVMLAAVAKQLQSVDEAAIATQAAQLALLPARIQTGTVTLAAGTVTKSTGITITANSKVFLTLNTPGGGTNGSQYKVPDASLVVGAPGVGTFVATAVGTNGATVNTDVSTLNYLIVG